MIRNFYKVLLVLLSLAIIPYTGSAQNYTSTFYPNAGNPPGGLVTGDLNTTGTILINASISANQWSPITALPFNFNFYGQPVTHFKVSGNGVLTFDTASTIIPGANVALPTATLPDNSIAFFWDDFTNAPPIGTNDVCRYQVLGTAPNRQMWVWYYSYEIGNPNNSFAYWAVVLEETTNKIYVVDQYSSTSATTSTVGVQMNATTGFTANASYSMPGNGTAIADNDYFEFLYLPTCSGTPVAGTSVVNNATPCFGQSFNLSLTGSTLATLSYQWLTSSSATGPWTLLGPSSSNYNYTTTTPNSGTYYYRCEVTCGTSSDTSTAVSVNVANPFPGGTYTIDGSLPASSTNFVNFASAVSAISCGIAGPVIFNVANAIYNEQIELPATIGANAVNTVTFNGNGATLTTNITATGTNYATLNLNGADYITFNNMTIEAAGSSYGFAVHLMNNADYNHFDACTIKASTTSTTTLVMPIAASGSAISYSTAGDNGSNNLFSNCNITGGYYSVSFYGLSTPSNVGNKLTGCNIKDPYSYGVLCYQQSGFTVSGCNIERPTRTNSTTCAGVYLSTGTTNALIEKNKIHDFFTSMSTNTSTFYGVYLTADATLGNENKIINNAFYNILHNGSQYYMYLTGADYVQAYHNSVSVSSASNGNGTIYGIYSSGTVGGMDFKNNNISIANTGTGTKYCLYFLGGGFQTSDNNNLKMASTTGTVGVGYYGAAFTDLPSWQTANGGIWDIQSVDVDPFFASASTGNLAPTNGSLDNLGTNVGVTTDILNASRSATTPDIGAFEFTVSGCTGTPVAGTLSGPDSVCSADVFSINGTGTSIGTGLNYQWQSSSTGALGSWTDINGATNINYSGSQSVATYYRLWLQCTNAGGGSDTSAAIFIDQKSVNNCYCTPNVVNTGDEEILNVTLGALNNSTTCASLTGTQGTATGVPDKYSNFTASTVPIPILNQGAQATISVTLGECSNSNYSRHCLAYIDWNHDGDFADPDETIVVYPYANPQNLAFVQDTIFTVPATATVGQTRMRIILKEGTITGPCDPSISWGEVEDYTIQVDQPASCGAPLNVTSSNASVNGATINWSNSGFGTPVSYSYYVSTSSTAPALTDPIYGSTTDTFVNLSGLNASTTYYVWVRAICSSTDSSLLSPSANFSTLCAAFTAPFTESFSASTPLCWNNSGPELWLFSTGAGPGYGVANSVDHTTGTGYFAWVDGSGSGTNTNILLTSPTIDISTLTNAQLTYYVKSFNSNDAANNKLIVEALNGTTWVTLDSIQFNFPTNGWNERTALLTGFSSTTQLRFRVDESNVGGSAFYNDILIDDITVANAPACINPQSVTATAITSGSATISWNAPTTPALGYSYYVSTSNTPPTTTTPITGFTTSLSVNLSNLNSGTPYYVWVRSKCSATDSSTLSVVSFNTLLVNDSAAGAIPLVLGSGCQTFTNLGATQSASEPVASCAGTLTGNSSVWFKFIAPTSGAVRISTDTTTTTFDTRMALYSATDSSNYGTFVSLACDDDNGIIAGTASVIFMPNLIPGNTYYIQVMPYSTGTGTFCLKVDELNSTMIETTASSCGTMAAFTSANSYTGYRTLVNNTTGKVVANLRINAGDPSTTSGNYTISTTQRADVLNQNYLNRNLYFNNASVTNADVILYFTPAEMTSLGASSVSTLNVHHQSGTTCWANFAGSHGTNSLITQTASGTVNGANWLQWNTPSFSNFYVINGSTLLPIELSNIKAYNEGSRNRVVWESANEDATGSYIVERSQDASNFKAIATVEAKGKASVYTYNDENPFTGINYYRLKMVGNGGQSTYSSVVSATVTKGFSVSAFPNPAKDKVVVTISGTQVQNGQIVITDLSGKTIRTIEVNGNSQEISLQGMAQGMYLLRYADGLHNQTIKIEVK